MGIQIEIGECSGCEKQRPIVNKRHRLCPECNAARLNPNYLKDKLKKGIEYVNRQQKKQRQKEKQYVPTANSLPVQNKPRTSVNKLSTKEAANKKRLHQVYEEIDKERESICSGCGSSNVPLSHSHIISRHFRKDLECEKENIVFDCLTMGNRKGCHDIWEHASQQEKMVKLLDYQQRMAYIYEKDRSLWQRLKSKE